MPDPPAMMTATFSLIFISFSPEVSLRRRCATHKADTIVVDLFAAVR
jgi:hypothetical protein